MINMWWSNAIEGESLNLSMLRINIPGIEEIREISTFCFKQDTKDCTFLIMGFMNNM